MRLRKAKSIVFIFTILFSFQSHTNEVSEVEEFVAIIDQSTPIHLIFGIVLEANNNWPLNEKANLVTQSELTCIRKYYSEDNLRKIKVEESRNYASKYSSRLGNDINLLNNGLSETTRDFFISAAENNGAPPVDIILKFAALDDDHIELYKLLMIDHFYSQNNGMARAILRIFHGALESCNVDIASLFNS